VFFTSSLSCSFFTSSFACYSFTSSVPFSFFTPFLFPVSASLLIPHFSVAFLHFPALVFLLFPFLLHSCYSYDPKNPSPLLLFPFFVQLILFPLFLFDSYCSCSCSAFPHDNCSIFTSTVPCSSFIPILLHTFLFILFLPVIYSCFFPPVPLPYLFPDPYLITFHVSSPYVLFSFYPSPPPHLTVPVKILSISLLSLFLVRSSYF
jgi:hypothetical protein